MTWNLWWRFADWRTRQDTILATIRAEDPDVLTIQEVWATTEANQAALIAEALGMHWVWSPWPDPTKWQQLADEPGVDFGIAVLSRWPITTQTTSLLPAGHAPRRERTALHAVVNTPRRPLDIVTTHLESAPHLSATRQEQVRALASFVVEVTTGPAVVTGDLNAEPHSDELRLLGGHLTPPAVPGGLLVDAWLWNETGNPGITWDRANPHMTLPTPSARIDYVLVGPGIDVASVHVANQGVAGQHGSDHYPVIADLKI